MVKIYHNPRCRKSREGLALVKDSGKPHEVILYLDEPLTKSELQQLLKMLGIKAIDLVRKQEAVWKSEFKGKELTNDMVIDAMLTYQKLIERPVVVYREKAVVGRPPEKILELLD